jgi:hypothetical protein
LHGSGRASRDPPLNQSLKWMWAVVTVNCDDVQFSCETRVGPRVPVIDKCRERVNRLVSLLGFPHAFHPQELLIW